MNRKLAPALVLVVIAALSVVAVLPSCASNTDYWTVKAPMPNSAYPSYANAAAVDGKIYVVGQSPDYNPEHMEVYDPNTNTWTVKASMPQHYGHHQLVAYQSRVYDFGTTNLFYDTKADNWTPTAPIPYLKNSNFVIGMQPVVVNGKIYVIGGFENPSAGSILIFNNNYVYDPLDDSWSSAPSIPTGVADYAAAVVDGKIYIIGGGTDPPGEIMIYFSLTNLVQIFDPQTGHWTQGAPIPTAMSDLEACTTTGLYAKEQIYVIGGETQPNNLNSDVNWTQIYDPSTNSWSNGAQMPAADSRLAVVNINDSLYALGGTSGFVNEAYTPTDYSLVTPSPVPTQNPTPTLTPTSSPSPTPLSTIAPSPSVPELPTWLILQLVLAVTVTTFVFLRRKANSKHAFP